MTAFAFILGCVPLWRASGAGAISRQVLGTCVIGGMMAASLSAVFFIPVSFVWWSGLAHGYLERKKSRRRRDLDRSRRELADD